MKDLKKYIQRGRGGSESDVARPDIQNRNEQFNEDETISVFVREEGWKTFPVYQHLESQHRIYTLEAYYLHVEHPIHVGLQEEVHEQWVVQV